MNMNFLSAILNDPSTIPQRPATTVEALKLIGEGWGSIFVVIGIMIIVILMLNKAFSGKK